MATVSELQQLYVAYFGRPADPAGLDYWVSTGISTRSFAALMFAQPEFQSVNSGLSVEAQVNKLYLNLFGRSADTTGLLYWTQEINSGRKQLASIANDLIYAATYSGAASAADRTALANKTSTAIAYTATIRSTNGALLAYAPQSTVPWVSGSNFAAAVSFMNTATATNVPTAAQISASVGPIAASGAPGQTFMLTASPDVRSGTSANDTFLALSIGDFGNNDIIDGGAGTDTIYAVMETATTLRPVISNVENVEFEVSSKTAGTIETFTANFDKSSGISKVTVKNFTTDNDDEDTVVVSGVTTSTSLKIIDDVGSGNRDNNFTMVYDGVTGTTDSASVEISSTVATSTLGTVTVAGIENITTSSIGGANASYKLSAADATTATINVSAKSGGTVTAANLAKVKTLNINAADNLTVNDNSAQLIKVSSVNVDSQAADKTVTLSALTTTATAAAADNVLVTVKGAGKAAIHIDTDFDLQSATNADTVTVNAADNTGGVSFTTSATAANKVTGGTGNDSVILGAALDKNDVIALGGGSADELVTKMTFNGGTAVTGAYFADNLAAADLPSISGVEVARINLALNSGNAGTGAMSAKTASFASTLEINGDGEVNIGNVDITINNIAAGQKVKVGSNLNLTLGKVIFTLADATGAADTLAISTDGRNSTATSTFEGFTAADVETITLDLASTAEANTTINAGLLSFGDATSVKLTGSKITSATVVAKTGATIDASDVTGVLTLTANDDKNYVVKGSATANTNFTMGSNLNALDVVTGGASTKDLLTATVNGLTTETGALKISGVETIELTTSTAASTINAAGIIGAKLFAVGANQALTLTNLAAGAKLQLGTTASATYNGSVKLTASLADATGNSDALTIDMVERGADGAIAASLEITGVETVTINDLAATGGNDDVNLAVAKVAASKLVLSGSYSAEALDLTTDGTTGSQTLNSATTLVDASAFKGVLTASAATNTATTFIADRPVGVITGGAAGDTFTIGSTANYINASVGTVDAGAGSDTLTVFLGGSSASLNDVTNAEIININLASVTGFSFNAGGGADATITAATVNYFGGKAGELYTATATLTDVAGRLIDASALAGSLSVSFGDDGLVQTNAADKVTIKGGQSAKDIVTASMSNNNTGEFTMSGVETLVVGNITGVTTVNLKNVTGLSTLVVTDAAGSAADITVENAKSGMILQIGNSGQDYASATVDVNLTSTTPTTDTITIDLVNTASALTVDTAGIETVNIRAKAGAGSTATDVITIVGEVTGGTINVSGEDADDEVTLSGVSAGYTVINAATLKGDLSVAASARASGAMTITAGLGSDIIAMENAADVLDGGIKDSDNDTLVISFTGLGGALTVDLTSATDQVQVFNGLVNTSVQKNFESVNASAYVQLNSIGADITGSAGANVIVGTSYADIIVTNGGNDTITGGLGNDQITLGSGADTVLFLASGGTDAITGFVTTSDKLDVFGTGLLISGSKAGSAFATVALSTNTAIDASSVFSISGSAALTTTSAAALFELANGVDNAKQAIATGSHILIRGDDSGTDYNAQLFLIVNDGTAITATLAATLTGLNAAGVAFADII